MYIHATTTTSVYLQISATHEKNSIGVMAMWISKRILKWKAKRFLCFHNCLSCLKACKRERKAIRKHFLAPLVYLFTAHPKVGCIPWALVACPRWVHQRLIGVLLISDMIAFKIFKWFIVFFFLLFELITIHIFLCFSTKKYFIKTCHIKLKSTAHLLIV